MLVCCVCVFCVSLVDSACCSGVGRKSRCTRSLVTGGACRGVDTPVCAATQCTLTTYLPPTVPSQCRHRPRPLHCAANGMSSTAICGVNGECTLPYSHTGTCSVAERPRLRSQARQRASGINSHPPQPDLAYCRRSRLSSCWHCVRECLSPRAASPLNDPPPSALRPLAGAIAPRVATCQEARPRRGDRARAGRNAATVATNLTRRV